MTDPKADPLGVLREVEEKLRTAQEWAEIRDTTVHFTGFSTLADTIQAAREVIDEQIYEAGNILIQVKMRNRGSGPAQIEHHEIDTLMLKLTAARVGT